MASTPGAQPDRRGCPTWPGIVRLLRRRGHQARSRRTWRFAGFMWS